MKVKKKDNYEVFSRTLQAMRKPLENNKLLDDSHFP